MYVCLPATATVAGIVRVSGGTILLSIYRVENSQERDSARAIYVCPRYENHGGDERYNCPGTEVQRKDER